MLNATLQSGRFLPCRFRTSKRDGVVRAFVDPGEDARPAVGIGIVMKRYDEQGGLFLDLLARPVVPSAHAPCPLVPRAPP